MSLYMISFVPLSDITSDAARIYSELEKSIAAGIEAGKYSPSYVKQYKLQLERIKEGVSDVEFVLSQTAIPVPGNVLSLYGVFLPLMSWFIHRTC